MITVSKCQLIGDTSFS